MFKPMTKIVAVPLLVAACTTAVAVAAYQAQPGQGGKPLNLDLMKKAAVFPSQTPNPAGAMAGTASMPGAMGAMGAMGGMAADAEAKRIAEEERERESERERRLEIITKGVLLSKKDPNPLSKAVWKTLEEPISMPFPNDTSLDDVLKYIQQAIAGSKAPKGSASHPLPIYVNPRGLSEAEKSLQSTISINLEGIPLKTTLRLILEQLDLAYCVRDGVLVITSAESIGDEIDAAMCELEAAEQEGTAPQSQPGSQPPAPKPSGS